MTIDTKLKIGEMPQPCYLKEMGDTSLESDGGYIGWIGMRAYGLDEQLKDFLWWRNFRIGNLNAGKSRHDAAAFIARIKMEMEAEAAIGLPVDLATSNRDTNYVAIPRNRGLYGVYVQVDKRQMFNFMAMMQGISSEGELKLENPSEFKRIFSQAKKVLPYHKKGK